MFGFKSCKFHRLLIEMPNIENCVNYQRRFFRSPMIISHEWPILGQFEYKKKQFDIINMNENQISYKNEKNKEFRTMIKPLVLDCRPLFTAGKDNAVVSMCGSSVSFEDLIERYEKWDQQTLDKYVPTSSNE